MKCKKCGSTETKLYYRINRFGKIKETHLCSGCAEKMGLTGIINIRKRSGLKNTFDRIFGRYRRTKPVISSAGWEAAENVGLSIPMFFIAEYVEETPEESELRIPCSGGEDVRGKRELNALCYQLDAAVDDEDFEKAAAIRDQIRDLEEKYDIAAKAV